LMHTVENAKLRVQGFERLERQVARTTNVWKVRKIRYVRR